LHNSDELIYLRDPLDAKTGEHLEIRTANADGKAEEQVVDLQQPARFFGDPAVSYDDRYVLIEATFDSEGVEDYAGNQQQPADNRLVLYDRFDRKVIDSDTRGTAPVWNH
jgi:hypothetical protein